MQQLTYTSRSLRRHGNSWEVALSHKDPATGKTVRTYHTLEADTQRQAERARDAFILDLKRRGGTVASGVTLREFFDAFLRYKEGSGTIEPSTVRGYHVGAAQVCRNLGNVPLCTLTIADVNDWMNQMTANGYAPKSQKCVRLLQTAQARKNSH